MKAYLVSRHAIRLLLPALCLRQQLRPLVPVLPGHSNSHVMRAPLEALHRRQPCAPALALGARHVHARLRHLVVRSHLLESGEAFRSTRQALLEGPAKKITLQVFVWHNFSSTVSGPLCTYWTQSTYVNMFFQRQGMNVSHSHARIYGTYSLTRHNTAKGSIPL